MASHSLADTSSEPSSEPDAGDATEIAPVRTPVRVLMAASFLAFATLTLLFNGTKLRPLAALRITTKFGMFSSPPKAQPVVVVGVPRTGPTTPLRVLSDPTADKPWLEALRDARERKLADNVAKTPALHQSYLAYHCNRHASEVREVRLLSLGNAETPEAVLATRRCDRRRAERNGP